MKLKTASIAPEFTATDISNRIISLADLGKKGPVVLVFLRGFS